MTDIPAHRRSPMEHERDAGTPALDAPTVAPEAGRYGVDRDGLVWGPFTHDTGRDFWKPMYQWFAPMASSPWTTAGRFYGAGSSPRDLIRLLPASWTPPPGWRSGDPLPEEPASDDEVTPKGMAMVRERAAAQLAGKTFTSIYEKPASERTAEERALISKRTPGANLILQEAANGGWIVREEAPMGMMPTVLGAYTTASDMIAALAASLDEAAR